ncbi:MAG TPA: DUF2019 domain-containing protein [Stellaceae bacterium]|jgi:hypothetical protein|nr:DUF2019 domain-containing protein [Stellaceae bacterium]
MKSPELQDLTDEKLAECFKLASFQEAEDMNNLKYYRKAHEKLKSVAEEFRRRGPEARRALVPLLNCQDNSRIMSAVAQCRLNAANELLAIEPARARATLEELANSVTQYQMALARQTLRVLNDGTFKPT